MDQHQYSNPSKDKELDSIFGVPSISLLDDKQWLYIQRRFHLTDRELQIAKLVCRGINNEDIAVKLKIQHGTVKTHIRNIYRRVRIKNKIQMVLKFLDTVINFAAKSGTTSAIPILGIKKSDKKKNAPSSIPKKE
ncbi:response regulator transcription factor [Planctomycetota bacterium]